MNSILWLYSLFIVIIQKVIHFFLTQKVEGYRMFCSNGERLCSKPRINSGQVNGRGSSKVEKNSYTNSPDTYTYLYIKL